MPAYDQVKVWTIDPSPPKKSSPRPRQEVRSRQTSDDRLSRQKIAERWSRQVADRWSRPAEKPQWLEWKFEWKDEYSVWARFAVVATLATAILWWPYGRSCGFGLAFYLLATTMIIVGGLWVVACTWILHMVRTHALAMLLTLWGAALITAQVLPRVGYAATAATWLCGPGR